MAIKRAQGFTLLEMLITVTVLAILVALAAPNFRTLMDRNAVVTQANELLSNLLLARSEATKRNQRVVIRSVGGWDNRFIVFADANNNDTYQAAIDGPLIVDHRTPGNTVTITRLTGTLPNVIHYNGRGRGNTTTGIGPGGIVGTDFFTLSKNGQTRYIRFDIMGRPRVEE